MEKLLVIADDFTGALDTGVQFTDRGAYTYVVMDPRFDFSALDPKVQVIVLDMESRHLPPLDAYKLVKAAVRSATYAGIRYIYKKTDSGLRGNIGAELTAALEGSKNNQLVFVPAFPRMNRNTIGGVHYIDGVPVAESMYGVDPYDPVIKSRVVDVIHQQSTCTDCYEHNYRSLNFPADEIGIHVMDASSDDDMRKIIEALGPDRLHLTGGCAAFAAAMAHVIGLDQKVSDIPPLPKNVFMACGSINPITVTQMENGDRIGFKHVHLTPEQKLDKEWANSEEGELQIMKWYSEFKESGRFILDSNEVEGSTELQQYMDANKLSQEDVRKTIAPQIARLTRKMLDMGLDATLICTGGDTFRALMKQVGVNALRPISEMSTGCVLTSFEYNGKTQYVITKSGGLGTPGILLKLCQRIEETNYRSQDDLLPDEIMKLEQEEDNDDEIYFM